MLSQNPRQADFVLGTCPHCQKVVRIPVTAVTSQSSSQVGCPICNNFFELASVLEEMIPAVTVVDDAPVVKSEPEVKPNPAKPNPAKPKKINAIDTPEIFHNIPKEDYEPITEKKNGRFVVPDLLSRGIDKKAKKKRKSRRRRSSSDPDVAKSLAKLKQNTSSTSLETTKSVDSLDNEADVDSAKRKSSRKKVRIRKKSSNTQKTVTRVRKPVGFFRSILGMPRRLKRTFQTNMTYDSDGNATSADIVMLILGAMIAIPMLHVILWWCVGLDPLGLAKPTSRFAPFLVPDAMEAPVDPGTPIPVEPSKQTTIEDDSFFESGAPSVPTDGKLPKPSLDPSSVHADEVK